MMSGVMMREIFEGNGGIVGGFGGPGGIPERDVPGLCDVVLECLAGLGRQGNVIEICRDLILGVLGTI